MIFITKLGGIHPNSYVNKRIFVDMEPSFFGFHSPVTVVDELGGLLPGVEDDLGAVLSQFGGVFLDDERCTKSHTLLRHFAVVEVLVVLLHDLGGCLRQVTHLADGEVPQVPHAGGVQK